MRHERLLSLRLRRSAVVGGLTKKRKTAVAAPVVVVVVEDAVVVVRQEPVRDEVRLRSHILDTKRCRDGYPYPCYCL